MSLHPSPMRHLHGEVQLPFLRRVQVLAARRRDVADLALLRALYGNTLHPLLLTHVHFLFRLHGCLRVW